VSTDEQAAWHAWRGEGWGASDIAAAWTGKYGSAYRVVAEKSGRLQREPDPRAEERMERGKTYERVMVPMVELATNWYVVGQQDQREHEMQPRWRCTVDGYLAESIQSAPIALVEFKTHGVDVRPAWAYYEAQVQWQMLVTGHDLAFLAVATVDDSTGRMVGFRLAEVPVDPLHQAALIALADQLEDHLAAGTLPEPDGTDLATEAVRRVTYTNAPEPIAVDLSDIESEVRRYIEVKEAMATAKTEQAHLENVLRDRIGLNARGVAGKWVVTYSKPRRVMNEERVLAAYPQLAKTVLDRPAADRALTKDELDGFREPIGARTISVRRLKGDTE
jgi:hypothetical protein